MIENRITIAFGSFAFPTSHLFGYFVATRKEIAHGRDAGCDGLIDALIDREGGYVADSADQGRRDPLRDHGSSSPGERLSRRNARPAA
jgi:hypothetical protein